MSRACQGRQQRADLGLSRQRHSPLHDLRILQGAGRLHQMQDPHAEAVNVGVNFREAADRVADFSSVRQNPPAAGLACLETRGRGSP